MQEKSHCDFSGVGQNKFSGDSNRNCSNDIPAPPTTMLCLGWNESAKEIYSIFVEILLNFRCKGTTFLQTCKQKSYFWGRFFQCRVQRRRLCRSLEDARGASYSLEFKGMQYPNTIRQAPHNAAGERYRGPRWLINRERKHFQELSQLFLGKELTIQVINLKKQFFLDRELMRRSVALLPLVGRQNRGRYKRSKRDSNLNKTHIFYFGVLWSFLGSSFVRPWLFTREYQGRYKQKKS